LFEAFEADQIGSSAMAYKRNPMRAERISALARFVISLSANTAHTAASQWLERNVIAGLEVGEGMIQQHVDREMPFMATERWLMQAVAAGGDRQTLHEVIRRHSLAVAEAVRAGAPNDLLARLAGDPAFHGVSEATLRAELDPHRFVGRAPQQVDEFLGDFLHPLLERARKLATIPEVTEVTV
jgi:adenylosuccinate lyase